MDITRTELEVDEESVPLGGVLLLMLLTGELFDEVDRIASGLVEWSAPEFDRDQALDEWRSEHELFSADATMAWLSRQELSPQQLISYLQRTSVAARRRANPALRPKALELLAEQLVFDFRMAAIIEDAATRAVASPIADARELESRRTGARLSLETLGGFDAVHRALAVSPASAEALLDRAARFCAMRARLSSSDEAIAELASSRWSLTRIEYVSAAFSERGAALEAIAQIDGERGLDLTSLGRTNGFSTAVASAFIGDLPDHANAALLGSALPGEMVGPRPRDGAWMVEQLLSRTDPQASDPEVSARVARRLLARHLRREVERRVRIHRGRDFFGPGA